jgi:PAS domain S-box-containing protein
MGGFKKLIGLAALLICISPLLRAQISTDPAQVRRIFFINTNSFSDLWTESLRRGFKNYLKEQGVKVRYEEYELAVYLQPDRRPRQFDIDAIQAKINATPYDLIVLNHNPAADLFLDGRLKAPPGVPLLVSSYAGDLKELIPGNLNLAGVVLPDNLAASIRLASTIAPRAERMVIITGRSEEPQFRQRLRRNGIPEERISKIQYVSGGSYSTAELLDLVQALPPDSVILFASWLSSVKADAENSYTVIPAIRERFRGLILGKMECYLKLGADGGIMISGSRQGAAAGQLAVRLLNGENPAAITAVPAEDPLYILDYSALEKAGVNPAAAPPEVRLQENSPPLKLEMLNAPPGFLEQHLVHLIFFVIIILFVLLFICLSIFFKGAVQNKVNMIIENLPMRIFVVNQSLEVLYSYVPDYPKDADMTDLFRDLNEFPSEIRQSFINAVQQVFATGRKIEIDYKLHDRLRHAKFLPLPQSNPFRMPAVMWISSDITDLHMVHLETFRLAERFRLALRSISDGLITTDNEGNITLINPVASKLTGYTQEEAEGLPIEAVYNVVSYIDNSKVPPALRKALLTGSVVNPANHTDLIARDGTRYHISDSAAPIRDSDGKLNGGVLVFRDVTDEYDKLDRLRANEVFMRNAARIGKFTYFRCSKSGKLIYTLEDENLWPYENDTMISPENWLVPADVPAFKREWNKVFNDEVLVVNMSYSVDLGGEKRYFEMRVEKSTNEINSLTEYCGVIHDVTYARQSEFRYRDNLVMLETIMNNLPGYIFVKNMDNELRYLVCNNKFEEMLGLPKDRIIGFCDRDIYHGKGTFPTKSSLTDLEVLDADSNLETVRIHNSSGKEYIVRTVKNVITQSDGSRLLLSMGIDISRQYELEQKQKNAIAALNSHVESERIINQLLSRISIENNFSLMIEELLRTIGVYTGADRAYVFLYDADNNISFSGKHEWARSGVVMESDVSDDLAGHEKWHDTLLSQSDIIITDMSAPPPGFEEQAAILKNQDIKSLIISGIWTDNNLSGFLGLDFVNISKTFSGGDIHTLHSAVNLFLIACERRRQADRLEDSVSLQRQIVDNVTIPLTIIDLDHNIVTANPSTAREYGMPLDRIVGMKYYEVIYKQKEPPQWWLKSASKDTTGVTTTEQDINGQKQVITVVPLFDRQEILTYFLISAVDITEITRQKQELQRAMELAQAADRAKSFFLATVSHELRTPLNAVIGFSELLQHDDVGHAEQLEYLRSINFAGNALLNLINDVLDLSRLEAGQMSMSAVRTDVGLLVSEIVSVFKLKAQEKNIFLKVDCAGIHYPLYIDNLRLRQMILNLVGNAVKFTASGGITVRGNFEPDEEGGSAGTLRIDVSDTGIGILPENAKKIFDPFVQEGFTRGNHVYEGSGLGLAITQRMVTQMGGEIMLDSKAGYGSVFSVRLYKIRFDDEAATETLPLIPQPEPGKPESGLRALIVDDVLMNLKLLQAMLQKLDIRAVAANSGKDALVILEKDPAFDLVLTDLWMPGMSGTALTEIIKNNPATCHLPVIAVTADTEVIQKSNNLVDGMILKPITVENLRKAIDEVMLRKQA